MIHTIKGFVIINKAEVDVFLELSCFLKDGTDVGSLISGSSVFSKSSLNIGKFTLGLTLELTLGSPFPHLCNEDNSFTSSHD